MKIQSGYDYLCIRDFKQNDESLYIKGDIYRCTTDRHLPGIDKKWHYIDDLSAETYFKLYKPTSRKTINNAIVSNEDTITIEKENIKGVSSGDKVQPVTNITISQPQPVINTTINPPLKEDKVNHPSHYTWLKDKCGIEVIDITRHLNFNIGNVIKYCLRAGHKTEQGYNDITKHIEDLSKAKFYIEDEIKRLTNLN